MSNRVLVRLSGELAAARMTARTGDGVLAVLSIAAFAVVTLIATITAAGTWMLVDRWQHPTGLAAAAVAADHTVEQVLRGYVVLAAIACALLLFPTVNLAASATMLGARSRERRLAALRLIGVTRGGVSLLAFLEVMVQLLLGVVLGGALTVLALPLFARLTLQAMPVRYEEMAMPWWGHVLVAAAVAAVAAAASAISMLRVRISPLGVARRTAPAALRWWRPLLLAAMILAVLLMPGADEMIDRSGAVFMVAVMGGTILAVDLAMPWFVQLASRVIARAPSATVSWAARRVAMNPSATWRRIGGIGLLILVASFFGRIPVGANPDMGDAVGTLVSALMPDLRTGFLLTSGFAFALAAVSVMVNQASAAFERADETRALRRMGVSPGRAVAVSWLEAAGPLAGTSVLAALVGYVLGTPFTTAAEALNEMAWDLEPIAGPAIIAAALCVGMVLLLAALTATLPIQRRILRDDRRR
ncbi:FtsX-like permease family protein [Corynebacterium sp. 335C]